VQKPVPLSNQSLLRNSYTFTRFFSFGGLGTACAIIGGCSPPLCYVCEALQRFGSEANVLQEGEPRLAVDVGEEQGGRHLQEMRRGRTRQAAGGESWKLYATNEAEVSGDMYGRGGTGQGVAGKGGFDDDTVVESEGVREL
jgi:hypothetical protein